MRGEMEVSQKKVFALKTALLSRLREQRPVIHCITNYVTANDVANLLLAAGASPVMADGVPEAEDIAKVSQGMVINLGTLREATIPAMKKAGKKAASLGHPIVLDPVGAGAALFRREVALELLSGGGCTVIRGNASEICTLARAVNPKKGGENVLIRERGVDADQSQMLRRENQQRLIWQVMEFARAQNILVIMSGETDLVTDGKEAVTIRNGHPWMGRITGSGCMLDGILAAFLSAAQGKFDLLGASVCAVAAMGICGELAYEKVARKGEGTGSFRVYLMDAMSLLDEETLEKKARAYVYEPPLLFSAGCE